MEGKNKVMCLILSKDLHGTARAAILWHTLLAEKLGDLGSKLNPYDLCVSNATIKGKQWTIVHYVDDTKVFHMDKAVVRQVHNELE